MSKPTIFFYICQTEYDNGAYLWWLSDTEAEVRLREIDTPWWSIGRTKPVATVRWVEDDRRFEIDAGGEILDMQYSEDVMDYIDALEPLRWTEQSWKGGA